MQVSNAIALVSTSSWLPRSGHKRDKRSHKPFLKSRIFYGAFRDSKENSEKKKLEATKCWQMTKFLRRKASYHLCKTLNYLWELPHLPARCYVPVTAALGVGLSLGRSHTSQEHFPINSGGLKYSTTESLNNTSELTNDSD